MKEKIARGEPALGCSVMFPSPQIVEMLGFAGFDWVLIDCEHGSIGPADVELMAMACDAVGITPIGRPKTNAPSDITSLMDRGVMGVQVPHVNTADDARSAVAAVKFGPGAARGLAAGTRRQLGPRRRMRFRRHRQRPVAGVRAARARRSHRQRRRNHGRGRHRRVLHRSV
jgi:4-hydroxy-2-oxoheptanedioate aldolase